MRVVVQRVARASVAVGGDVVSQIGRGLFVLVGIRQGDTREDAEYVCRKILGLRVFEDEEGKMWSRSVLDLGLEVLAVSQFTLYGRTTKGYKPDFHESMPADESRDFYHAFMATMRASHRVDLVKDGVFGAYMECDIVNTGPVTIVIESKRGEREDSSSSSNNNDDTTKA